MSHEFDIPPALRWPSPFPRPRDVEVFCAEHHCSADCVHITEAHRLGREEGIRAERERQEQLAVNPFVVAAVMFLTGLFTAAILRSW